MPLPADVADRIGRNWEQIPPDVRDRLQRAGYTPSPLPTAPGEAAGTVVGQTIGHPEPPNEPGLRTAAAEMAGSTAGEFFGGPLGSGAGTVLAGTGEDLAAGRPLSLGRTATRFATGAVIPPAVGLVAKGAGKALGAGARAITERLPSFAEFAEGVAPEVLKRGARALKATGDLGHLAAETVMDRFNQWSHVVFRHVDQLAGDAPVVPTSSFQKAATLLDHAPGGLTKAEQDAFEAMKTADAVPFGTARHVEIGFNRLVRKSLGWRARGDPMTAQWQALAEGTSADLKRYLETPDAVESGVGQALNAAKAEYAKGLRAMDATFLYRRSMSPGGRFNAARFADLVKKASDRNVLVRMVGEEKAPVLRQLAEEFGKQTEKPETFVGKAVRKYTVPTVGAVSAEEAWRRGDMTPLATGALALGMLHPAGRALMSTLAGQGLAAGARQQIAQPPASDFLNYLRSQQFTP